MARVKRRGFGTRASPFPVTADQTSPSSSLKKGDDFRGCHLRCWSGSTRRQTSASTSHGIICLLLLSLYFVVVKQCPALPAWHALGGAAGGGGPSPPPSRPLAFPGAVPGLRGGGGWGCGGGVCMGGVRRRRRIPLQPRGSRARFAACREGSVRRAPRRAAPSPLPPGGSGQGRGVPPPPRARFAARGSLSRAWARRAMGAARPRGPGP